MIRPEQMPTDTPDYMAEAWVDCLRWAIGEPKIRQEFESESGLRYSAPRSPIDAMIDDATGAAESYVSAFVDWFNRNVWGKL